ncbi:CC0125/CC1285 family lipoprotein [Methylobacterium frigidaeris]|uniref:DUF2846 domain-containing protein n=1 Tax=Methylobacterium frigidaeris TaxID=2038277 RepID=A0AA37M4C1_9HYPH|nr:hypothetical protein [Methylobacterium frigidaeris]GJD61869.1 hypothetical protein MPEAHAMD_2017 [Methylobacterium frigidaeris]
MSSTIMRCAAAGAALLAALATGACQTSYKSNSTGIGLTGGVRAEAVTPDLYRIEARGNGFTSKGRVQDFVMMKAAEITLANGRTHFLITDSRDTTERNQYRGPSRSETVWRGDSRVTTTTPGFVNTVVRPGEDAYVRLLSKSAGPLPPEALDAAEVKRVVGPRLLQDD